MIYLLSDLHGRMDVPGFREYLTVASENDLLILLGDVCINFSDSEENRKFTKEFLSVDKKIAFIDGNHENFDYINSFPQEEWNGGTVCRLTENILLCSYG